MSQYGSNFRLDSKDIIHGLLHPSDDEDLSNEYDRWLEFQVVTHILYREYHRIILRYTDKAVTASDQIRIRTGFRERVYFSVPKDIFCKQAKENNR